MAKVVVFQWNDSATGSPQWAAWDPDASGAAATVGAGVLSLVSAAPDGVVVPISVTQYTKAN